MALSVLPFTLTFGYYPSFLLFMAGILSVSMVLMVLQIFVISKVQKKTPNENLGKVMAIIMAIAQCAAPVGQVLYGIVFEAFQASIYLPMLFVSVALLVIAGVTQRTLKNEGE